MIRAAGRWSGYVCAGLLLALALLVAGFVWRLSQGPLSLKFATPLMHRALNAAGLGVDVGFDDTILTWDRAAHTLEIRARGVSVSEPGGGAPVARVPEAQVTLSVEALLKGRIAPMAIGLIGPVVTAQRRADGRIVLVEGQSSGDEATRFLGELLNALKKPPAEDRSDMRFFRRLDVSDADLNLHDVASDTDWRVPQGRFTLTRGEKGIDATLNGAVQSGAFRATLDMRGHYESDKDRVTATADIGHFIPKDVPPAFLPYPVLKGLDMTAAATVDMTMEGDGALTLGFELAAVRGRLDAPDVMSAAVPIDDFRLRGAYDGRQKRLTIEDLSLKSDELTVAAAGLLDLSTANPAVKLTAQGSHMTVAKLKAVWPVAFKAAARGWIAKHILDGAFDDFSADVNLPGGDAKPAADAFVLRFRFKDLKATYLDEMPAIEGAKGVGRLDLLDLMLTIDGARTLNLTIPAASVHIDDLSIPDHQDADIHVTVVGEVAEALKLLDYEPLRFPSKFGMKPGDVLGQSETQAHFTFPLVDDLGLDDVKFEADADLKNVNLPHLFAGSSTDHGTFALHVDPAGLFAKGTLSINTVPFDATWAENFKKGVTNTSSYTLSGVLDDAAWARFHLPFDERIAGSSPVTLTLIGKGQTISDGRGHLNLTPQQMSLGELGWEKKAGDEAGLDFTFKTSAKGLTVTSYTLRAPALNATGALTLKPDFSLIHARVNMGIGASAMSLDVYGQEDGGFEVFADGGTIDLKPMLSFVRAAQTESRPVPSLAFGGHFTRGLMRNGVELKDIVVDARFIQGWWEKGSMLAEFGDGEDISFSLNRDGTTRVLDITSSNAGEILKGLDYYASGQGGRANITAMIDDSREGSPVTGRARVNDIIIRKAPVMAKLLTLASFTGIADTLSGEGIRFEKVDIPFTITDGVMRLKDAGAYGPAIGLTVEGLLDRNKETVDLGGSIIPSYTLNSFLGKIPLIGPLFSGREGEGLIGFTYRVTGDAANPTVSVNPLSALAPGFLRGIFREMDPPPSGKAEEAPAGRSAPVQ